MRIAAPDVSVVVPVRDGGSDLPQLIDALSRQTLGRERFEVLLADDGSTDGSTAGLDTEDGWLRVLRGPALNSYSARNRAACVARGRVLAFCDADCRPEPTWLEHGLSTVEDADIVAGVVRFIARERRTVWSLVDMDTFLDQERAVRAGTAVTANLFVRSELFERIGGFDESFSRGADRIFVTRCVAAHARLTFEPRAAVWHPAREGARDFLGKLWAVNRRHGERESIDDRRPSAVALRRWVPVVSTARSRRRNGRSLLLDRRRLRESGVRPRLWDDVRALPVMYLLLPYVSLSAQMFGWWRGRRRRSRTTA